MSSFYLTLPSNSSMDFYPNNTLANYITKLPQLFDLTGEWEVGMSEIQYPISWYNISKHEAKMLMKLDEQKTMVDISPPEGLYDTADILVKQINSSIARVEEKKNSIRFHYNEVSKKISIEYDVDKIVLAKGWSPKTMLKISKPLAELFGFEWTKRPEFKLESKDLLHNPDFGKPIFHDNTGSRTDPRDQYIEMSPLQDTYYTGDNVCDLQRGFYSLYVYCDILEDVVVGDVKAPLLRTVNINGKDDKMVSRIYQTVQYVTVQRRQFDTIEIDIRDDTGRRVPFQRGKVIVTLHFRLRKPSYF